MENNSTEIKNLMKICSLLTTAVLENGGETHRAEETISLVCRRFGYCGNNVIALPTGATFSVSDGEGNTFTEVCRITKRSFNLKKLDSANTISRGLINGDTTLFEAEKQLVELNSKTESNRLVSVAAGGISSAFFAVLYGGGVLDFIAAFICGVAIQLMLMTFKRMDMFHFIVSCMGSVLGSAIAAVYLSIFPGADINMIIIGAIMPLLPGLVFTNAIRDTINGDLVSGIARLAEALLVAVSLAAGVGIVLSIYMALGGAVSI